MVARKQSPELAVPNNRDRHRGVDAHVTQIFAMDRRHVAQDRLAHVKRLSSARILHGSERSRVVVDLSDQPKPVLDIKRARLLWDVRGRIMQIKEGIEVLLPAFRDHPSGVVRHKAVDQHAVISRHLANPFRGELA